MKMTLAKALTYKKRVLGWIAQTNQDIIDHNSYVVGNVQEVDVKALYDKRQKLVDHLVSLKMSIAKANVPIVEKIFRLAECKGEVQFWRSVCTTRGKSGASYRDEVPLVYDAVFSKVYVDNKTASLEQQIDTLQGELDSFNHNIEIEIDNLDVNK